MRRRRDAIVLAASLLAHALLLGAWISTRHDLRFVEPPTMQVSLMRLPPKPAASAPARPHPPRTLRVLSRPLEAQEPQPAAPVIAKPAEAAASDISPEWRVKPEAPGLAGAPFAKGRRTIGPVRPSCKTPLSSGERPLDCPPDAGELAASKFDAAKDGKLGGFEAEGRRKRAMKTYHELPGDAGYPGVRCAIFHRC